jgi:carbamoyltransferase
MYILGINAYHADSSAALLKDGEFIAAIEEERFTRVKHWAGFPHQAIRFCLETAGIQLKDVDYIGIGRDPKAKLTRKIGFVLSHPQIGWDAIQVRLKNRKEINSLEKEFAIVANGLQENEIRKKIIHVEHHRAHLASAFFASPFRDAALLSIDGSGDFTTTMLGHGNDKHIEVLDSLDFPHSIGIFYSAMTQFLGFHHYGDEYKIMGLAPYGNPKYVDQLKEIIQPTPEGKFRLDLKYFTVTKGSVIHYGEDHIPHVKTLFSEKLIERFGTFRDSKEALTPFHKDLAASVQRCTEEIVFHLLHGLYTRTGSDRVCIAGGVAQNSVANGKIIRKTPFKEVYIPSAGHDAGLSMGSALYIFNELKQQRRQPAIYNAYLGSRYSLAEIKSVLEKEKIFFKEYTDDELYDHVTQRLMNGGVIGWFAGSAEFGPRALGGRSILMDPRRTDAKEILNAKIKRRESFRPFAPSILKEYVGEYFEWDDQVPFMEKVIPIKEEKRSLIPAVTHVDGTGRLQTVTEQWNPRYYRLIKTFHEMTGVPILLNTSFNENEPIVNTPKEALDCYLRTNMDMLVLENMVIERN